MNTIVITTKQSNKIKRALKALEEVRNEVSLDENAVDVNWYLNDSLCLMNGDSHSGGGNGNTSNQDNVIEGFDFPHSSGGGW